MGGHYAWPCDVFPGTTYIVTCLLCSTPQPNAGV